jgi:endonuclease-3
MLASLQSVVNTLRRYYGKPTAPVSQDPFPLILWEQVAYLVPDAQRHAAYIALRSRVGLTPGAILRAPATTLCAITRLGGSIAAPARAARLRRSAELVVGRWSGNLRAALKLPPAQARRALAQFPMIGEPGADKILAFTKTVPVLALDSNALRVLQRLSLTPGAKDYRTAYRKAQAAITPQIPTSYPWLIMAAQLLRQHGQVLCRRKAPDCRQCPLRPDCPVGRGT